MQCEIYIPGSRITYYTYRTHLARYVFAAQYVKDRQVLDIACGSGYGSSYLFRKGAKSVVGADINEEAIQIAKTNYQGSGLTFQVARAEVLPFADKSFDVITSMGTVDHMDQPDEFMLGSHRVLRDGGYFIVSLFNREVINPSLVKEIIDPYHKTEYSPMELADLIGKHFTDVKVYGQNYGGKRHSQIRSIILYLHLKFRIPYAPFQMLVKSLTALGYKSFKLFKYSNLIVYSEDAIDSDIKADSEWTLLTSKKMASQFVNYLVVGQKVQA
jgi:ubiquinone/menaquinone biosynthesis C-methylase UbiE